MSPRLERAAARLARGWVRLYSKGLPAHLPRERVDLILSHISEQERGAGGEVLRAADIVAQTVMSVPADVRWRVGQRRMLPMTHVAPATGSRERVRDRRPRTPGLVYTAGALIMLVVVSAVALSSRAAPPPTIAEFAPQAVEQITDSSLASGDRAAGAEPAAQMAVDPVTGRPSAQTIVDVARVRQCVGDPPRQVEDPQSPPCVPYWSGDNGGATTRGVTRDEIRIVDTFGTPPALAAFFNRRFELYGRRIRLIARTIPGDDNPAGQRAAARDVYEQDQAFASNSNYMRLYLDELTRYGIVGVSYHPAFPERYLAARGPYLWTYPMANDRSFALMGNWYCARFAGRDAVHAGDPLLQASPRKAGVILAAGGDWHGTSAEPMTDQLASCGADTDAVATSSVAYWDQQHYQVFLENAMLQMKTSGVTTLACFCVSAIVGQAMRSATNQGYFPEWLLTDYMYNDSILWNRITGAPEQLKSLMLLLASPMQRRYPDHPSNWAMQETTNFERATDSFSQKILDDRYRMLLLLASGIQMAGPHLTAQTFEKALHQTRFPNPTHRINAGSVGFDDGDHSMTDDATEVWWSNTAQDPYPGEGPGAFCYVDAGARRRTGTFPTDDPFFAGPCDTGQS